MNERIRKLLEQTDIPLFPLFENQPPAWVASDYDMEKFAELIVRECAQIAKTAEPWKSDDLILKHFGVKDD